ncbi:MAG: hypothetical protein ABI644_06510 [Arenimonas sp.]
MSKKIIFAVLLMHCVLLAFFSVPSANAQVPAAKTTAVRLQSGLTLYAPTGWTAQPALASKVVLANVVNDSLIVASLDPGDISLAGPELTNGITMANGVFLRPTGTPRLAGGIYSNTFIATGTPTQARAVVMIRATNGGRLISLIGLAPPARIEVITKVMSAMLASAKVEPAKAPSMNGELASYLKGRYLVRFYSGNGYSEKHEIWLCSNGEFRSRFDGGGFTQGVASGAFAGSHTGRWSALGVRANGSLSLAASDGSVSRFDIREASDGLMLNGKKWMRGQNQLCN